VRYSDGDLGTSGSAAMKAERSVIPRHGVDAAAAA
jgi:hypothetical protein